MAFTPRQPNASDITPTDNDLVLGDVHADLEGAKNALKAAKWNPDTQRLFTVGDNVDRGHQAKETLDFLKQYGAKSIMGNHDWAHHRYAKHMLNEAATGKKNPMNATNEMRNTMQQLGDDYVPQSLAMGDYPLYLPFQDSQGSGYLVHGGVNPTDDIQNQEPGKMMIRRHHPHPKEFMEGESEEHPFWQRSYQGHLGTMLHGHSPSETHDFHGNPNVYSLDGGGVFGPLVPWGGKHRVMRLGDRKIFEAPGSEAAVRNYLQNKNVKNG